MRFLPAVLLLSLLFQALPALWPTGPDDACAAAQTAPVQTRPPALQRHIDEFTALGKDQAKGNRRDFWLALEKKFHDLAAKSGGDTAASAAFYKARTRHELGRRSFLASDYREAANFFSAAAAKYPRHHSAPENLYFQADILINRLGKLAEAIPVLESLLKKYPKSGKATAAKNLLTLAKKRAAEKASSARSSSQTSSQAPGKAPDKTASQASGKTPGQASGKTPGQASGKTPGQTAGKTSGQTSGQASGKSPQKNPLPPSNRAADGGAAGGRTAAQSLMDQLGLTVQTIMLDAGHGGKDPGARAAGIVEKQFTLAMTRRVGALLQKKGFTVLYTRSGNSYISLQNRPDLANRKKADLFISLHVNANNNPAVRGLETYYLDEAKTQDAALVAARENAISVRNISDLQFILTDLMLSSKVKESHHLADCVHAGILKTVKDAGQPSPDNGVRSAPFYVLVGARMPAILVEFGYITNSRDAANLQSDAYLQLQAEGLVAGILQYRAELAKSMSR